MGNDHHGDEPSFDFKEYPRIERGVLLKCLDGLATVVTGPVKYVRENIVKPNQKENHWYHRRFRRVPTIDQCYTDDSICIYEANEQFYRDRSVESNILKILRDRMNECVYMNPHNQETACAKVTEDYKVSENNYFIKYGDLGYGGDAIAALAKQKHRIVWERRHGPVGQGRKEDRVDAESPLVASATAALPDVTMTSRVQSKLDFDSTRKLSFDEEHFKNAGLFDVQSSCNDVLKMETCHGVGVCCKQIPSELPGKPIGIFWDIENVQVPKGKCALRVVQAIRDHVMIGYREAEFMCVCDINKELPRIVQQLNDACVNVVHVPAISKNAADDKLRMSMRRFVDYHQYGSLKSTPRIVLISRDVNFAPDLSDFRHRRGIETVLISDPPVSLPLTLAVNEHFSFSDIVTKVPTQFFQLNDESQLTKVLVRGLAVNRSPDVIQQKLRWLSNNCGGRVEFVYKEVAVLNFRTNIAAERACKRIDGCRIFGNVIRASIFGSERDTNIDLPTVSPLGEADEIVLPCPAEESQPVVDLILADRIPDSSKSTDQDILTADQAGRSSLPTPIPPATEDAFPTIGYVRPSPPLINLEIDDGTMTSSQCSVDVSAPTGVRILKAIETNEFWQEKNSFGMDEFPQLSTEARPGKSVTKVCTLNGHADWLKAQLSGKDSPKSEKDLCRLSDDADGSNCESSESVPIDSGGDSAEKTPSPDLSSPEPDVQPVPSLLPHADTDDVNEGVRKLHFTTPKKFTPVVPSPVHTQCNNLYSPNGSYGRVEYSRSSSLCESDKERRCGLTRSKSSPDDKNPFWLIITNLESGRDAHYLRSILLAALREHVEVCHLTMHHHGYGSFSATVRLKSVQDQQLVISNLQRKKVGNKRILISHPNQREAPPLEVLRAQVMALLQDVPGGRLPLFKFRELFENRFNGGTVSIADLNHMADFVCVEEDHLTGRIVRLVRPKEFPSPGRINSGREIQLSKHYLNGMNRKFASNDLTEKSVLKDWDLSGGLVLPQTAFCLRHTPPGFCRNDSSVGWAEKATTLPPLPNVNISLKVLGPRVHSLLGTHDGVLPLASLPLCYEDQFGVSIQAGSAVGVHLEHLVTCIQGIQLINLPGGYKHLKWQENGGVPEAAKQNLIEVPRPVALDLNGTLNSEALQTQMYKFSREIVDLLRTVPRCMLLFNKFIPAYHHHFGRQCRVSEYGFTKLIDLFVALPHVVQIIGEGLRRVVTLTHAAQVRRFLSELLRIVKAQPNMQLPLSEFADQFFKLNHKAFDVFDYGVCCVADLLTDLPESVIQIDVRDDDTMISIPRREQTPVEMERTKQFAFEVQELLKNLPHCRMSFNKFIPAYHHLFGKQCRVANYGFSKLIELFEAIPHMVEASSLVIDQPEEDLLAQVGERTIRLVEQERLKVLGEQILQLVKMTKGRGFLLADIPDGFADNFGYILDPVDYGAGSVDEIVESRDGPIVISIDRGPLHQLGLRVRSILLREPDCEMQISAFTEKYQNLFDVPCSVELIRRDLFDIVEVLGDATNGTIELTPLQKFGRNVQALIRENQGRILISNFERLYAKKFGSSCSPSSYGHASLSSLLHAIPEYVFFKGRGQCRCICLNRELLESPRRVSNGSDSSTGSNNGAENGYRSRNGKVLNKAYRRACTDAISDDSRPVTRRLNFPQMVFSQSPRKNDGHYAAAEVTSMNFESIKIWKKNWDGSRVLEETIRTEGERGWYLELPACPAPVTPPDPNELPDPSKVWA
ncbi:unnamed protein product [Notodromas monacha]|uniref:NADH dehydrogenase [ubiquinone] 1 beta subcomplex subunit 10 n=1 Tax=Notodromas monacha TaxID=399045 RepID=A0A7R9BRJ4_9CRUS|nr:unnamed protein product [Notodromas monacha]CAG0919010.1 unnamed protein product [Notodromas monacha]